MTENLQSNVDFKGDYAIGNLDGTEEGWAVFKIYKKTFDALVTMPDTFHNTLIHLVRIVEGEHARD